MTYHAQRLLVAASRGARIQHVRLIGKDFHITLVWESVLSVSIDAAETNHRIHPDDAHLQYGPIATELRKMTIDDCYCSSLPFGAMAISFVRDINFDVFTVDDDHFSWLCLFAAELAADEGM